MKTTPRISNAEWEVMNVIWDHSPATANQVDDDLAQRQKWQPRTTRTLLARLVKKRAVKIEVDGRRYLYHPLVKREAMVQSASRSFLDRFFRGAPAAMVLNLVREAKLSESEIEELRRILRDKEK